MVRVKRIYDSYEDTDGFRILVDRLWPRGVSKSTAHLDLWLKEVAPSDNLRRWFNHDPVKWTGFQEKYKNELDNNPAAEELRSIVQAHKEVTLLFGAKDEQHNQAVVLSDWLAQTKH